MLSYAVSLKEMIISLLQTAIMEESCNAELGLYVALFIC